MKAAGLHWTIEKNFQAGKGLTGLDKHQVRRRTPWYRWVTLTMLTAAVLTIAGGLEHDRSPARNELIPLTRNEIARLPANTIIRPASDTATSTAPGPATASGNLPKRGSPKTVETSS